MYLNYALHRKKNKFESSGNNGWKTNKDNLS